MKAQIFSSVSFLMILTASLLSAQQQTNDSNELESYIADIREWRMTEFARMSLRSLAGILTETSTVTFFKDEESGAYWRRYGSGSCPDPNMSPDDKKKMQEEYESKIDPVLLKLHPLADTDSSGFVTGEEGAQFRQLVEFAYLASYVATQEEVESKEFFRGINMDQERFKQRVAEYKKVLVKARNSGLDFPELNL